MVKMLIIADDLTGALDTGVQFSKYRIATLVGMTEMLEAVGDNSGIQVLVLNTESRYLAPEEAYKSVYNAVRWAREKGIEIVYKKTDSVLRGNIGSELTAVLEASKATRLFFIPAFPKMERYTVDGIQYLGNIPLAASELGKDSFNPVSSSSIADIIREQSSCNVAVIRQGEAVGDIIAKTAEPAIYICDASTEEDIKKRLTELDKMSALTYLAGCAGGAGHLAERLKNHYCTITKEEKRKGLLISCGSLSSVSEKQLNYLQEKGIRRIHLIEKLDLSKDINQGEEVEKLIGELQSAINEEGIVVLDTFRKEGGRDFIPELRFEIAALHGTIAKALIDKDDIDTVFITGGDTLMGFVKKLGCTTIRPVWELKEGVVLSELWYSGKNIQVISKSGGFGNEALLHEIVKEVR